ncbi:MAG: SDR family NAD(P)-dependent oxidoreductase [Armatimonadota bacterium]
MFDFTGKVVLVAGGAGYLLSPACKGLAEHGAAVVIADMAEGRAERAAEDIRAAVHGARVQGIVLNACDEAAVRQVVDHAVVEYGRLDITVCATYRSIGKYVEELAIEEFREAVADNLSAALILARESARVMADGGSIILFASMYGQVAPDPRAYVPPMKPNPIEYGVAKAGIIQMAKYLAAAWGPRNIRVNAIAPGPFPFPKTQEDEPEFTARLAAKTTLGRVGRQDEIAGAVVYLASDEASYVTGETISVNGGWTAW